MGSPAEFSQLIFRLIFRVFEVCEAIVLVAILIALMIHTLRRIVQFARGERQ